MDWIAVAILFVARFLDSLGWRSLLLFVVIALAAGSITRAIRGSAAMILEEMERLRSDVRHSGGLTSEDSDTLKMVESGIDRIAERLELKEDSQDLDL